VSYPRHISGVLDGYLAELVERAKPGGPAERQVRAHIGGTALAEDASSARSAFLTAGTAVAA
jgi:hypothetical protein